VSSWEETGRYRFEAKYDLVKLELTSHNVIIETLVDTARENYKRIVFIRLNNPG
jgi:hypothetical protein